jgi:hypothetical protein
MRLKSIRVKDCAAYTYCPVIYRGPLPYCDNRDLTTMTPPPPQICPYFHKYIFRDKVKDAALLQNKLR